MGNVASVALIMAMCHARFSAFQYALLSTIALLPRYALGGPAGRADAFHHLRPDRGEAPAQRQQVIQAVEDQEIRTRRDQGGRDARRGAGGEDEHFVIQQLAVLQDHALLVPVDEPCLLAGEHPHTRTQRVAVWSELRDAVRAALTAELGDPVVMCHVSHAYETGASLYFTFLARQERGAEIEQFVALEGKRDGWLDYEAALTSKEPRI